jgi:hypothetical protein
MGDADKEFWDTLRRLIGEYVGAAILDRPVSDDKYELTQQVSEWVFEGIKPEIERQIRQLRGGTASP